MTSTSMDTLLSSIDDAEWHSADADFPKDLPPEAGGTHIGFLFAWLISSNLMCDNFDNAVIADIEARRRTGRECLFAMSGGVLRRADLSHDGQRFLECYYNTTNRDRSGRTPYYEIVEHTLAGDLPSMYHIQDSWDNYDLLEPAIDGAFAQWRRED